MSSTAFVHNKSATSQRSATETEVRWWQDELVALVTAMADEAEAARQMRLALDGIFNAPDLPGAARIVRLVDE